MATLFHPHPASCLPPVIHSPFHDPFQRWHYAIGAFPGAGWVTKIGLRSPRLISPGFAAILASCPSACMQPHNVQPVFPFGSPHSPTGSDLFDLMLRNLVTHPQSPDVGLSHQPSMLAATFSLLEVWSLAASGADLASLGLATAVP